MRLSLNLNLSKPAVSSSIPFENDANTYWWDYTTVLTSNKETTAADTITYIVEAIRGVSNAASVTKDKQPLVVTDGGSFNKDTHRFMNLDNVAGIANGTAGWYAAFNFRPDTSASYPMTISRNASSTASRGDLQVPSSREFGFKAANADGGSIDWIARGPAITLGTWITAEMEWDLVNDLVKVWYDGVLQTLSFGTVAVAMTAFNSTDPSQVRLGNSAGTSASNSFDGPIQHEIFYNGLPSSSIRQSISDYLVGVLP